MAGRERDRELLLPVVAGELAAGDDHDDDDSGPTTPVVMTGPPPPPPASGRAIHVLHHHHPTGIELLLPRHPAPIAITFYTTWWFIRFVDGFFSPIYVHLGIHLFGLGFVTSITFIFLIGVFMSSWLGASLLGLGEFFIKRMPSCATSTLLQSKSAPRYRQSSRAFKEVVIIRHPRIGEYALGFITSTVALRGAGVRGDQDLACVYVPTNNLYLGDIFLMSRADVIIPDLSVREAIEIVLSGGMSVPKIISAVEGIVGLGDHGCAAKDS
ncbi:hypothetical protein HU200_011476 [Digitaria exilis]|uniref:Uncharacterized protein n=1 Tax=Digitaria exilis TaxID=1010633 RepID=A0A835KMM8_9POAL|nr:hypothetical protein HU200_011476 [Digitaria exilis]